MGFALAFVMAFEHGKLHAETSETGSSTAASTDDVGSPECVLTVRALNGELLCTLPAALPAAPRWRLNDLREAIEAQTGIPAFAFKLFAGDEALDNFGELALTRSTEITLLKRSQEVVEWIVKIRSEGCSAFRDAPEDIKNDPHVCLEALSVDKQESWRFVAKELLRDDEFLAAALKQDANMFEHTRCIAIDMDFLTGCAKLRASGRMNWGSRGPITTWSNS